MPAAELFPTRRRMPRRQPFGYKRFEQAAQAIRFAMEDLPPEFLVGAFLEVDERRYGSDDIRRLYESAEYPLTRRQRPVMTDKTIDLDQHRGMAAQKATGLRRLLAGRGSQREGFAPSARRIGNALAGVAGGELA